MSSPVRSILLAVVGVLAPMLYQALFGVDPGAPVDETVFVDLLVWIAGVILTELGITRLITLHVQKLTNSPYVTNQVAKFFSVWSAVVFAAYAIVLLVAFLFIF